MWTELDFEPLAGAADGSCNKTATEHPERLN